MGAPAGAVDSVSDHIFSDHAFSDFAFKAIGAGAALHPRAGAADYAITHNPQDPEGRNKVAAGVAT